MRRFALALLAAGCGDAPAAVDMAPPDLAPIACGLIQGIQAPARATPGAPAAVAVTDGGSGRDYQVAWSAAAGKFAPSTGKQAAWTPPATAAVHQPEKATVTAVASAPGCLDETAHADLVVDWPDPLRTVVVYNPAQAGSQEVAQHYADFRAIPAAHLCPIPYADPVTVAGADFDAWLAALLACVDGVGPQVHYLVPVWGVPYKLAGRVRDTFNGGAAATVSLDSVLALGHDAATAKGPTANAYLLAADPRVMQYDPYVPFGVLRDTLQVDFLMVARIDGADAAAAKALVDRTRDAEQLARAGQLAGTVYVDGNKGLPHPTDYLFGSYDFGEWNIIGVENVFTADKRYPVVADYDAAEFGTAPAPAACPDALYYAGWYSFGHYNDVFTWKPGAIGGHLDSCSACDIRGGGDWSAVALARGITATFGAVNEPYVLGLPAYDRFFHALLAGASYGEAGAESTFYVAWMLVFIGDPLYRPYGT